VFAETDIEGGNLVSDRGADFVRNENAMIVAQEMTRDEWRRECTILNPDDPGIRALLLDMETNAYTFKMVLPGVPDPADGSALADVYALRNGRKVAGFEKNTSPGVRRQAIVLQGSRTMTLPAYSVAAVDPDNEAEWPSELDD